MAVLVLANGAYFEGDGFGALEKESTGELVFSTSMSGYVETLTDPSYYGQLVVLTYPEIGNYGVCLKDCESNSIQAFGLIVRELSPIASNWRSQMPLDAWLQKEGIPGMRGIDTRALVAMIRQEGAMMAVLSTKSNPNIMQIQKNLKVVSGMQGKEMVSFVSTKKPYAYQTNLKDWQFANKAVSECKKLRVVVFDFGVKKSILDNLVSLGCEVVVVSFDISADAIWQYEPHGVVLTNGPGDPGALPMVVQTVSEWIGKIPLFGICMGHQILAQALGMRTYKLPFGHRGSNQPVLEQQTGCVRITSQNHGFAVDSNGVEGISQVHISDQTVEGISIPERWILSVQYHPEGSPGPLDAQVMFHRFMEMMLRWNKQKSTRVLSISDGEKSRLSPL